MKKEDIILLQKLEELNNEYQKDGNYIFGSYIKDIMKKLKKGQFISVFRLYISHLKNKRTKKNKVLNEKENINSFKTEKYFITNDSAKKIAVYTCITGNYDKVEEPIIMENNCDYFLFTNNKNLTSDCWRIKKIPDEILKKGDNPIVNRYLKLHPRELFEGYDYSIYLDGNIRIISNISDFTKKINPKTGLAIHKHTCNICIYKEVEDCIASKKGNKKMLKQQIKRYKKDEFPKEYGVFQCSVLVCDLKNDKSSDIFNKWWNEYLTSESRRDQIALPYVLWKNNISTKDIGNLGNDIYKNPKLKINNHK